MAQARDKRLVLYPTYIDSTVSVSGGRYITKEQAVPNPDVLQMLEACKLLSVPAAGEEKHYSRTWWIRGRLRVSLKKEDGSLVNPAIPNKRALLVKIAETIRQNPNLPRRAPPFQVMVQQLSERSQNPGAASSSKAAAAALGGATSSSAAAGSGSAGNNNKKKKGKK